MTIKLNASYGKYKANDIIALDAVTEAALIAAGQATATLTGGTPYVDVNSDDVPIGFTDGQVKALQSLVSGGLVLLVEQSAVPASVTGTTAETTLATIAVPAMGANDSLRVTALFTFTSSVNLKTMFGKLNGSTFAQNSTSTSGHTAARVQWQVTNRNNTASQLGTIFGMGFTAGAAVSLLNPTVETSGANTMLIRGQLASGSESLTLEGYTVELIKK